MSCGRQFVTLVSIAALVVLSGCVGGPTQSGSAAPNPTTDSGAVLAVSEANQTQAAQAPNASRAHFEDLSADRQDEFASALEADVDDPTAWGSGAEIQYVRYEGTWYFVTVVIVN